MSPSHRSAAALNAARKWCSKGEYDKALAALEPLVDDLEALRMRADVLALVGRYQEALDCHRAIVKANPRQPAALVGLATCLTNQGKYKAAVKIYDRAIRLDPGDAVLRRERALALRLDGNGEAAIESYDAALRLNAADGETWAAKADTLIQLHRFAEGMACLERAGAAPIAGLSAIGWASRGWTLSAEDAFSEALHCFDKALELEPDDVWALRGKAAALRHQADVEGVLGCYDRLISLHPEDAETWALKGDVLADQRRFDEALDCYQHAVKYDRKDKYSWANSGFCRAELRCFDRALADFERAIELDQNIAVAWEGKGRCLYELQRSDEALGAWKRALKLDPKLVWAYNNIGWVLFVTDKNYEEALTWFDRALELDPTQALVLLHKVRVLFALKRSSQAMRLLTKAMTLESAAKDPEVMTEAALVFSDDLHDAQRALELLDKAIEIGGKGPLVEVNRAEMLIRLDRLEQGRKCAFAVMRGSDGDLLLKTVAAFLVYAAHALEGDSRAAERSFAEFANMMAERALSGGPLTAGDWRYDGLLETIIASRASLATKFALAATIDLQTGQLASPALAKLRGLLPLVNQPATTPQMAMSGAQ